MMSPGERAMCENRHCRIDCDALEPNLPMTRHTLSRPGLRASTALLSAAVTAALQLALPSRAISAAAEREIPPAFGPHVGLQAADFASSESFSPTNRLVGTYYFYWYDAESKSHVIDGDGSDALTTHPPTLDGFSYKSVAWHKRQLSDMIAAGIDVALPVFWGAPSEQDPKAGLHWSYAGLPPLVQAREELLREGRRPPRLGLFYDTSTLEWNAWHYRADLTTDYGKRWFYATVRDFFSCVPAKHWAMMDGKPIVLLYASAFAKKWDQGFLDYTKAEFSNEFGGRVPWIAAQDSWAVKSDGTCAWGGALGMKNPGIGAVGPGYDHSAVPGRTPLIVDRRGGKFYEEQWLKFLRRPSNFVMVETWNEFHEGTDVAESREYGRQYIELTAKYAGLFKQGWKPPRPIGPYTGAKSVSLTLGDTNREAGLRLIESADGQTKADREGRVIVRVAGQQPYIYFAADDAFKWAEQMTLQVEVEYFDAAVGSFTVEFDGSDPNAPLAGAYTRSGKEVPLTGDRTWQRASFPLEKACLLNSQNSGADFRLAVSASDFVVRRVSLTRP